MDRATGKDALRRRAAKRRADAFRRAGETAPRSALRRFVESIEVPDGAVIAGYWPIREEIDPRPILHHMHETGHECCLPVVPRGRGTLLFRAWRPGMALLPSAHGTRAPGPDSPEAIPTVVLVPLLAFDGAGHRLGYGAGYYDRTLRDLRGKGPVLAVGLAFTAQRVEAIPRDDHDEWLDWVVTEEAAHRFA